MSLTVVEPGLYSLVVDGGRPHCRSLGLPVGGAADRTAWQLGNALVGNPAAAAALEIALAGPTMRAEHDVACVVHGAPFELRSERQGLRSGTTFTLRAGETLTIGGTPAGMRAYLCVRGGFETPLLLDSRSALAPLQRGEQLPCAAGRIAQRWVQIDWQWDMARDAGTPTVLRVLDGPQANWFPADVLRLGDSGLSQRWRVTPANNRMGLRLQGAPLPVPAREMVSEPVCPGSVQVTRDGQCIILGVDGQTIGGYPKLAQVISADLDKLAQLRPGTCIQLQCVTLDEAEKLQQAKRAEVAAWCLRVQAMSR